MSKRDYYKVLGVKKNASQKDIKQAYRRLAKKFHPDQTENKDKHASENDFKEAAEAHATLSDPEKRAAYDQFGHAAENIGRPTRSRSSGFNFRDIFGGDGPFGQFRRKQPKGEDVSTGVRVTLEEIATGVSKQVNYTRKNICHHCRGLGGIGNTCPSCRGFGKVNHQSSMFETFITNCPKCKGRKVIIHKQCTHCKGVGHHLENHTLSINVPPGISDKEVLVFRREGGLNDPGLPRGDVHCYISVTPHDHFTRSGINLGYYTTIKFTQACLGTKLTIPILNGGTIELNIPSGTQYGQVFRISGQGLPGVNNISQGTVGDLLVKVEIKTPSKINKKARQLLKELDSEM